MNLKQINYFCETVDAGNARAAAEKLFVAPTAISMQISQLEALLGGALFDRATRPMALTPLGQFVYSKGRELLSASARLELEAKGMAAGKLGWLGIGFTRSTIFSILPEAVRAMQSALPGVRIDLLEILTEEQPAALRSGAIHLAIARTLGAFTREPDLHYTELFDDPLVAALPAQHPLAARASLAAAELNALPYVSYPKVANAHFSRQVLNILEQAGAKVQVGHEAKEIHTALGLVAAGLGTTVVGRSVAANNRSDIRFVPIADLPLCSKVLAVRKDSLASPLVDAFLGKLREQAAGREP
jgi:LysR family transcriptional regulator, benzoate and cis,cis-muconate-responsive activator of ben and cat genes